MKRTAIRKKAKKKSTAWWKAKFWEVFSRYIRIRDKGVCFTCGRQCEIGRGYHAGHIFSKQRGGFSIYFNEFAVFGQCYDCNINLGGNGAIFATKYIELFGQKAFDTIYALYNGVSDLKWGILEYQYLIALYEKKINELLFKDY